MSEKQIRAAYYEGIAKLKQLKIDILDVSKSMPNDLVMDIVFDSMNQFQLETVLEGLKVVQAEANRLPISSEVG